MEQRLSKLYQVRHRIDDLEIRRQCNRMKPCVRHRIDDLEIEYVAKVWGVFVRHRIDDLETSPAATCNE